MAESDSGGAVFFGVCRGKLSEGLDFSDRDARTVILVGIPFRNIADPGVKIKMDYLNQLCEESKALPSSALIPAQLIRDGDTWYKLDAVKCLVQAMGRAHRH